MEGIDLMHREQATTVLVDICHPLARKKFMFWVTLRTKKSPSIAKILKNLHFMVVSLEPRDMALLPNTLQIPFRHSPSNIQTNFC